MNSFGEKMKIIL